MLLVLYFCGPATIPPIYTIPLPDADTCQRVLALMRVESFDLRAPGAFECRPLGKGVALEPCYRQDWEIP